MNGIEANQKVWVGNLTPETTQEELEAHFRQLGEPVDVKILKQGVGCVAYASAAEAETAISAFNGSELGGTVIQTDSWTAKPTKGLEKGARSKGGCVKGNGKGGGWGMGGGMKGGGIMTQSMMAQKGCWGAPQAQAWGGFGGGGGKAGWGAAPAGGAWGGPEKGEVAQGGIIMVNAEGTAMAAQGMSGEVPALAYEKGPNVFSSAAYILGELVQDISTEVEIVHDQDWEQYPDLGEAIKASTGEEHCFAVAVHANSGKWALGLAPGWKGRENAVKLALAVAMVADDPAAASRVAKNHPEFGMMLKKAGCAVNVGGGGGCRAAAGGWKGGGGGGGMAMGGGAWAGGGMEAAGPSGEAPAVNLITLTQESAITTQGFPAEACAIMHGGKAQKEYFSNAHSILQELVEDLSELTFHDDPEWTNFPEVHAALTEAGVEDNCYCVAMCPPQSVWAVGMANGWKGRESAGKMALAITLAQAAGRVEELGASYPEFGEICAGAGLMQAPKKRRKGGW